MKQDWVILTTHWLWLVPLLAVLAIGLWFLWRKLVRRRLAAFLALRQLPNSVPYVRWYARGIIFALTTLAMMLLAVALARPLRGPIGDKSDSQGIDFVIALDVSKSMWVEDVAPFRLAAVKKELGEWIRAGVGDRIGLVLFAGDAFVQAPVTFDRVALDTVLQQAGPKSMSLGGTNLPAAVEMATHLLKSSESRTRCLVIVTDGENLEGDAVKAVRDARQKDGLYVFTVGVGTLTGGKVPQSEPVVLPPGTPPTTAPATPAWRRAYAQNEYGMSVTSRLDNRVLRLIAEAGGGRYYEFRPGSQTFNAVRTQGMLAMIEKPQTIDVKDYEEWYQLPLGVAIALLVAAKLIPVRAKKPARRPAAVDGVVQPETYAHAPARAKTPMRLSPAKLSAATAALLVGFALPSAAFAAPQGAPWDEAEKLLAAKKADDAIELMRNAIQSEKPDQYLSYNYAMTLYRAGRYEEAAPAFEAARLMAEDPALREKAAVLAGNALTHQGTKLAKTYNPSGAILSLERALGHFDESAMQLSPQTAHNRKIAADRLEALLMQSGKRFTEDADKIQANPQAQEEKLKAALQAYERVETLNPRNKEAPPLAEEIRKRLAKNLSKQAEKLTQDADQQIEKKERPESILPKLEAAVAKVEEAQTLTPEDQPLAKQKQEIQDKASDLLTEMAKKQMDKPMKQEKLNDFEQGQLASAKQKLDQAVALNQENQEAKDLGQQAAEKLEKSYVERGKEALAQSERPAAAQTKAQAAQNAANQFENALELNPENKEAQEGLAEANEKLPELLANAGDAELAKAMEAAGQAPPPPAGKGKPTPPKGPPDLRKAIGHLEKADQQFGLATAMAPQDQGIADRAEKARQMLDAARDQLDQQSREALAQNDQANPGEQPGEQPSDKPGEKPGEPLGQGKPPPAKQPLSMSELKAKAKPLTGDNFWEKRKADY